MERPNLDIVCQATVQRVLFRGSRAIGVEYERGGIVRQAFATREVILSASALRTPQLLMLSGIGPAHVLQSLGIPVLRNAPGVGQNLQDHPSAFVTMNLKQPLSSHYLTFQDILDYDSNKTGPLVDASPIALGATTSYFSENSLDLRWSVYVNGGSQLAKKVRPLVPNPLGERQEPNSRISDDGQIRIDKLVMGNQLLRPYSRGSVSINSRDAKDIPVIDGQLLADPRDRATLGYNLFRAVNLTKTNAFRALDIMDVTVDPENRCLSNPPESNSFYECCGMQYTRGSWHHSCTARMGAANDPHAVVDPRLRVYGVQGLRVVDASVMVNIPRGNTNIPVIMIAEKASDMIKQDWGYFTGRTPMLRQFDDVKLLQQSLPVSLVMGISSNISMLSKSDVQD
jgi:choline dehydrogenase